jgi:hypothetical protein
MAVVALGLAAMLVVALGPGSAHPPGSPQGRTRSPAGGSSTARVANDGEPASPEARAFSENAEAVAISCDLPIASTCEGSACVAFVAGPDLDHLGGWLRVVASRPRFVATVVLRDLGVAPGWTPCGEAVAKLAPAGVWAIERADGSELWCAGRPADCDTVGAALRGTAEGAFQASTRRLSLGPPVR